MQRRTRTNYERSATRAICPAPTLLAVLLLVTIVPGAAAYAVIERDVAHRTILRDPSGLEPRELSARAVTAFAGALKRTVERHASPLPTIEVSIVVAARSASPAIRPGVVTPPPAGHVRLSLLNLPPPLA